MLHRRLCHDLVDVIHQLNKAGGLPISQLGQVYLEIGAYAARITPEHDNPVGEQDRLFDIVCNHEYGGGRHLLAQPQLHQFIAKVFGCKNIKRGKGFVHEQNFRFNHKGSGEANPLLHPAGQFFRICRLEAVQADCIQHPEGSLATLDRGNVPSFQRCFDVLQDRQPRVESEALKDDCHIRNLPVEGTTMP